MIRKGLLLLCFVFSSSLLFAQQDSLDCEQKIDDLIDYALKYMGVPYIKEGSTPAGFDCSGFVCHVYKHFGIELPRHSGYQWEKGKLVLFGEIRRGDLVFFTSIESGDTKIGHVGIAISDYDEETKSFRFIHANSTDGCVSISDFRKHFLRRHFGGARRIIDCN